jgi:hypothetical protein
MTLGMGTNRIGSGPIRVPPSSLRIDLRVPDTSVRRTGSIGHQRDVPFSSVLITDHLMDLVAGLQLTHKLLILCEFRISRKGCCLVRPNFRNLLAGVRAGRMEARNPGCRLPSLGGQGRKATLEPIALAAYDVVMSERPSQPSSPADWRDSLARSKAQIAAGESVPLLPVLDRLRASAERLEAEQGVTADGLKVTSGR